MNFKAYSPYAAAVLTFFVISLLYFAKPISEGKKINLPDINNYKGTVQEIDNFKKETGETTYWTNSIFGGMPTYLVRTPAAPKPMVMLHNIFNLKNFRPVSFVFLYLLGFYITLLAFGVNPWLSMVGAFAYAFSSYFFIIIEAGHASKAITLGYLPAIIAGVHLALNKRKLLGSLIMALFLALQLKSNHPQITYYTFIIAIIYAVVTLIYRIKEKQLKDFALSAGFLVVFGLLALGSNLSVLLPTLEYSHYSIRGESELKVDEDNQTSGLDFDYATDWSYGVGETFTLLIPNFKGGASGGSLPEGSATYELYKKYQGKSAAKKAIKRQPTYWGDQPFTSGPVYVGAIIVFLAIFSFFVLEKKYLWWLITATFVSFILAWGRNIPNVTRFLFEYVPMLNKFRSVSMGMVIAEFTLPLMAMLALSKLFNNEIKKEKAVKALKYAGGITGGLLIFFLMFAKGLFDFSGISDSQYLSQQGGEVMVDALEQDRLLLLRKDAFRSLVFVALSAGIVWFYIQKKMKLNYALAGIALLVVIDMWGVNQRYLNSEDFVSKKEAKNPFTPSPADNFILQDKSLDYRVLNIGVSTFNDASTSYFHKSIGGYHGAKMQRYQELITYHIGPEIQKLYSSFKLQDFDVINRTLSTLGVLNMLNTKYIIYNPQAQPLVNNYINGNAWFVNSVKWAENANEEIDMLKGIDTKKEAVIDSRFKDILTTDVPKVDSAAEIILVEYKPNYLKYQSSSEEDQLAIFSEIYYPHGWHVSIDGEEAKQIRANYVLRGLEVPAGEHQIEFTFVPEVYKKGHAIAQASIWILILIGLGAIGYQKFAKKD